MSEPQAAAAPRRELRARFASAAVLIPVALFAVLIGGIPFALLVAAAGGIAFWEWTGITAVQPFWLRAGGLVCLAAGLLALASGHGGWAAALLGLPILLGLTAGYRLRPAFWTGLGLAYVAVPCAAFILLRTAGDEAWTAILFLLVVVWTTDIAAYFGGRALGGPKLWPRVSPKKTWSGALSGLAAALVAGGAVAWLTGASALSGVLLAAPLSIACQAGDLLESALKRRFSVKDSGHIIPGHGGVLDRIDGLFAAAALAWFLAAVDLGGAVLWLPGDTVMRSEGMP